MKLVGEKKKKISGLTHGYFGTDVLDIDFQSKTSEWFTALDFEKITRVSFHDGTFHYTKTLKNEIFSISAKCDKF